MKKPKTEKEIEEEHSAEFARTGISIIKMKLDIQITEEDMLRDLIDKTEGKNIPIEDLKNKEN